MGLRDIESTLPPGFRFYPSDEELICHYLYKKVCNEGVSGGTMVEVDLHSREPWELPEGAKLSTNEWYFFSFRDRKYSTGSRANRATKSGYWKATGKDRTIYDPSSHAVVGMRKTLVFYGGRAPNGIKSNWVMHEFRLENDPYATPAKEDWVLCRVFHKKKGEEDTNMTSCFSPTMESSSPHQMVDNQEGSYRDHVVGSSFSTAPFQDDNCTSAFLEMDNFLHCNFLELPQQLEVNNTVVPFAGMVSRDRDDFGIYFDVGGHGIEEGAGFGNLRDFRFQGDKDRLYYQ